MPAIRHMIEIAASSGSWCPRPEAFQSSLLGAASNPEDKSAPL